MQYKFTGPQNILLYRATNAPRAATSTLPPFPPRCDVVQAHVPFDTPTKVPHTGTTYFPLHSLPMALVRQLSLALACRGNVSGQPGGGWGAAPVV